MPVYSIHIQFADGSNPYVRYCMTGSEFAEEKAKWDKNYVMVPIPGTRDWGVIKYYKAFRKEN